jgi:hypothetical protein
MGFRQAATYLIRQVNKYTINRVTLKLAGTPLSTFRLSVTRGGGPGKPIPRRLSSSRSATAW